MCTLIAIHRSVPGRPLIVAANRDEYYDRPAEGPSLRRNGRGYIVAPRDVRAGGTWLGLNEHGVFAALTNLRNPSPAGPDLKRNSRGKVVTRALEAASAHEAIVALGALGEGVYNPFNCYVADAQSAYLAVYCETPRIVRLEPGVHVVGNTDASLGGAPKVSRVEQQARRAAAASGDEVLSMLAAICREHASGGEPLDDTCVHVADTYGTRSSILLELTESCDAQISSDCVDAATPESERETGAAGIEETEMPIGGRLLYADGPPCVTEYEDFTSLLQELRQAPGYAATGILARKAS